MYHFSLTINTLGDENTFIDKIGDFRLSPRCPLKGLDRGGEEGNRGQDGQRGPKGPRGKRGPRGPSGTQGIKVRA